MKTYKSADRRAWIRHYQESGNISATCQHFGISRSTFYKWLQRYDPARPSKPLMPRSRRRKTNPTPRWNDDDLNILAELDNQTGARLGAGRLSQRLQQQYDTPYSRATVGRMLARVRKRCPLCGVRNGHHGWGHAWAQDLLLLKLRREEREAYSGAYHP
jgi:transposase